jgi:hypothetical protein
VSVVMLGAWTSSRLLDVFMTVLFVFVWVLRFFLVKGVSRPGPGLRQPPIGAQPATAR